MERESTFLVGLPTNDELALVEAARRGEAEAFERLMKDYLDALWRYALRIVGNSEDAKDVVQQTLFQVHQALPKLTQPDRFRPWLFKIARNKAHDHNRRAKSRPPTTATLNAEDHFDLELTDQAPLPEELIERQETQRLLRQAIETLPDRQKQVAALRYATDLSFAEIGEVLGLNENSVKTLFQRAKPQLRAYVRALL